MQLCVFLIQPKEITWSPSRVFPPVRACMFSSHLAAVTFLADPSAGGGLPRGTFIYATSAVPVQVRIHWAQLQFRKSTVKLSVHPRTFLS